ncbi:hypothetical protein OHV05_24575 [Kitasatospora sp. NBC_00070]|uniref:hypothetical protein n=1 Tax=Kitasatospora sp. NBC_00070 TaxID=2975962 RepID=UPI00324A3CF9
MTDRIRLDDMTDDQLDQLYARAENAEADRNAAIERADLLQTQVWDYRQRILDIDAHATPYDVREEDPEGSPRAYLITVGSLHRALGTVGQSAAKCDAEAKLDAVRNALHIADAADVTDWQRGYRAAAERALAALNGQPG